jgi:endonuclease III
MCIVSFNPNNVFNMKFKKSELQCAIKSILNRRTTEEIQGKVCKTLTALVPLHVEMHTLMFF